MEKQTPVAAVEFNPEVETEAGTFFLPDGWRLSPIDPEEPEFYCFRGAIRLTCDGLEGFYVDFEWVDPLSDEVYGGWELSDGFLGTEVTGTWDDYPINFFMMPWADLQQGIDQVLLAFKIQPYPKGVLRVGRQAVDEMD